MRLHIYWFERPDLHECHVFEDVHRLPDLLSKGSLQVTIGSEPWKEADVNICQDTGHRLPGAPLAMTNSFFWCLHCHSPYHQAFARSFERSFGADLWYVQRGLFKDWLPNGVGLHGLDLEARVEPGYDVGLVGQWDGFRAVAIPQIIALCDRRGWTHFFRNSGADRSGPEGNAVRPHWGDRLQFSAAIRQCRIWLNVTTFPKLHLLNNRVFEAMAMGRPCVSDCVLGSRELVPEGEGVMYYDWESLASIEPVLERLLSDPVHYQSVADAGTQSVANHTILARYKQLLAKTGILP